MSSVTYSIRQGDSLSLIARQYGTSVDVLLEQNRQFQQNPNRIEIGDHVVIPCQNYTVVSGDNMVAIAKKNGYVTREQINAFYAAALQLNPTSRAGTQDLNRIEIGLSLKIPEKKSASLVSSQNGRAGSSGLHGSARAFTEGVSGADFSDDDEFAVCAEDDESWGVAEEESDVSETSDTQEVAELPICEMEAVAESDDDVLDPVCIDDSFTAPENQLSIVPHSRASSAEVFSYVLSDAYLNDFCEGMGIDLRVAECTPQMLRTSPNIKTAFLDIIEQEYGLGNRDMLNILLIEGGSFEDIIFSAGNLDAVFAEVMAAGNGSISPNQKPEDLVQSVLTAFRDILGGNFEDWYDIDNAVVASGLARLAAGETAAIGNCDSLTHIVTYVLQRLGMDLEYKTGMSDGEHHIWTSFIDSNGRTRDIENTGLFIVPPSRSDDYELLLQADDMTDGHISSRVSAHLQDEQVAPIDHEQLLTEVEAVLDTQTQDAVVYVNYGVLQQSAIVLEKAALAEKWWWETDAKAAIRASIEARYEKILTRFGEGLAEHHDNRDYILSMLVHAANASAFAGGDEIMSRTLGQLSRHTTAANFGYIIGRFIFGINLGTYGVDGRAPKEKYRTAQKMCQALLAADDVEIEDGVEAVKSIEMIVENTKAAILFGWTSVLEDLEALREKFGMQLVQNAAQ